jgi:hypothetical protein
MGASQGNNPGAAPQSTRSSPLQTRQIDGKTYKCTAVEFAKIQDDANRLTKRQQTFDFVAVALPYAISVLVMLAGTTCVLVGHSEATRWLWGAAGLGSGTSVTAAGIRRASERRTILAGNKKTK